MVPVDATGGGEFAAIERIAARMADACGPAPAGELWIGDDAAVVRYGGVAVVVAADALVAGVHADLGLTTVADLGWKALAVNVSDLAAMGCVATRAVVTVSGPEGTDLEGLYGGLVEAAAAFGCPVVGGDLTAAAVLVVSVTALGNGAVAPPPVTRSGARVADDIWVTGPLGGAAAGLRQLRSGRARRPLAGAHARPWPRVAEGVAARELGATAMIDVSDGFAADLGHVLDASGVAASLADVPVRQGATEDDALGGGDDYELVWCAPPGAGIAEGFRARGLGDPLRVGVCVEGRGTIELRGTAVPRSGWVHRVG